MSNINQDLLALYKSKWGSLCASMQDIIDDESLIIKPTCPLLISVNDENIFQKSDIKLVIYGQETNNWYDIFNNNIETIINNYNGFFNNEECWSYGGHFWNGIARFLKILQTKYPDKKINLIWNNLVKIGKYQEKGFPPDYIYKVEKNYFSILEEELKILQPTIVLFLTGPDYDNIIIDNFTNPQYNNTSVDFSSRQIARISLMKIPFVFRTYHPGYLWRNDINKYFQTIVDAIKLE